MKTILCYGDANTHGTRAIDFDHLTSPFTPCNYRLPLEKRWTTIMAKELGIGYHIIEEGLNGRTTVWDDPIEGNHKNGLKYLIPCLESHAPIDIVIIMLGQNDLKKRFSVSAYDIAMSIGVLVKVAQNSGCGPNGNKPEVLVLCPAPLGKLTYLSELFGESGVEKSKLLAKYYKKVAKLYNCHFYDVGRIISTSEVDGAHYKEEDLKKLGKEVAKIVKKYCNNI